MSENEIAGALSALDTISAPKSTVMMGPFAIFHSQGDGQVDGFDRQLDGLSPSVNGCENVQSTFESLWEDHITWNIPGLGHQDLQNGMDMDDSSCAFLMKGLETFDLCPSWILSAHPCEPTSSSLSLQSPAPPSPYLELSMPLFQDHQTSTLMSHYMNHVADLLQPVLHPSNPWRTTYFPFALEGCPELFLSQNSSPSSYVSIALFNSVLSSAAFHLRNVSGGSSTLHKLGLQHRTKSLQALNAALVYPNDYKLYTVYLTAMLSLVTIDVRSLS